MSSLVRSLFDVGADLPMSVGPALLVGLPVAAVLIACGLLCLALVYSEGLLSSRRRSRGSAPGQLTHIAAEGFYRASRWLTVLAVVWLALTLAGGVIVAVAANADQEWAADAEYEWASLVSRVRNG